MGAGTRQLMTINGAAIVVMLLSAAMYTSDQTSYSAAYREREAAYALATTHGANLRNSESELDGKLRAWLARSGRERFKDLSRSELFKTPWKTTEGRAAVAVAASAPPKKKAGVSGIGPGRRCRKVDPATGELEKLQAVELSDEALHHWENTMLDKRRKTVSFLAPMGAVVTTIPGREEPPPADAPLTDHSGGHPTLVFDKDKFGSTPVGSMTDAYKPPTTGKAAEKKTCDEDFGNGLVKRWRETREEWCSPKGAAVREGSGGRAGGSKLACYFIKQSEHGGDGDNLCVLEDVSVDLGPFSTESVTDGVIHQYKSSSHNDEAYIHFGKGTVQAQCKMDSAKYSEKKFPGWNADWLWKGLDTSEGEHERLKCEEWEDVPTLVVQRDTFANMYHDTEDFVNAYLALAVLELPVLMANGLWLWLRV